MSTEEVHSYAFDKNNLLVNANSLDRNTSDFGELFYCLCCDKPMIAKLGQIKRKHFAHKFLTINCSYETYLHKLAKRIFYSQYTKCLENNIPFNIILLEEIICNHYEEKYKYICNKNVEKTYDITKYFDLIHIEKGYHGFIADIFLSSSTSKNVLFIEFAVSHKCEPIKINSGIRIIEYSLDDEYNLEDILNNQISHYNYNVAFFNFNKFKSYSLCQGICDKIINVFCIYKSYKSIILEKTKIESIIYSNTLVYYKILGNLELENKSEIYRNEVLNSHFIHKIKIKNCFLCKYHGLSRIEEKNIFCRIEKQNFGSNQATQCNFYNPFDTIQQCNNQHLKNKNRLNKYFNYYLIKKLY